MKNTSIRQTNNAENIVNTYGNMLFRLCLITLGNANDAEDAVQETFIRYLQKAPYFDCAEYEKAWLITVATNKCKDILRFRNRHTFVNIDDINEYTTNDDDHEITDALMEIPDKFRLVLVLYYVEGYSINEISKIIKKTPSAVKMRLQKGRRILRESYGKEHI